jgi:hypothetical protein
MFNFREFFGDNRRTSISNASESLEFKSWKIIGYVGKSEDEAVRIYYR